VGLGYNRAFTLIPERGGVQTMAIALSKLAAFSGVLACLALGPVGCPESNKATPAASDSVQQIVTERQFETQKKDGKVFYVSPDGKPNGNGKKKKPLDLRTALGRNSFPPGATIYLLGGVYRGKFVSSLSGSDNAPITVRSAPGEWAIIDGNGLDATGDDTAQTFQIFGNWVNYRDFEVMNSSTLREIANDSNRDVARRGSGIVVFGKNNKIINLVVHDNVTGIYMNASAENTEVYGVISYNNGLRVGGDGAGHGMYVQNQHGTKLIRDSIILNNFGYGIQAFADNSFLLHITMDGNVIAGNGMPATRGSSGRSHIFVGSGTNGADDITISNNYTYNPPGFDGGGFGLGYGAANGGVTIINNYVMGGASGVGLLNWANAVVTSNTIYVTSLDGGKNSDIGTVRSSSAAAGFNWNGNTYYDTSGKPAFKVTTQADANFVSYQQWQASGYDQATSYETNAPTWTRVFVRPNRYESGRAHIIVYNFDSKKKVSVDLSSVFSVGDNYEIRDAQNYGGAPVASGTYNGEPIQLSLAERTSPAPLGFNFTPRHMGPEFSVFVAKINHSGS
jgi:hypothetical protein